MYKYDFLGTRNAGEFNGDKLTFAVTPLRLF